MVIFMVVEEKRKGLIIVHSGSGKGKTTGAMGLALRTVGHNLNTLMIQFIKGTLHYGE
jgi:cob(I)alamin adenosyltransferase